MACLPLIERELRVALRKQRPAKTRLKIAALATAGSVIFLLLMSGPSGSRYAGRNLEQLLFLAGLYSILRAPLLIAGVLAEERRNETLGLLFLSGLSPVEVFAGKFLSSTLVAFTNLLAIFPMLALPFLIGGVSFDLFLATICVLPALMLFVVAASLLASALTRDEGAAVVLAYVLIALLCLLPWGLQLVQGTRPSVWVSELSPAYGGRLIWSGFYLGFHAPQRAEFWRNVAMTAGWSGLELGIAALALNRLWRDRGAGEETSGWRARWREVLHGNRESRQRLGREWLDINPFVWLAGRDRQPAMLGGLILGGIVAAWLLCWLASPVLWPSVLNFFVTAVLLNSVLAWLGRHTAARALGEPRRDGAYELLLTTPLLPADIVWGTLEALRTRFRLLAHVVFLLNAAMMLGGLVTRPWSPPALMVYFCVWLVLLTWTWNLGRNWQRALPVMWASLNCGRPLLAVWRTSGFNSWSSLGSFTWIWILYNLPKQGFRRFPTGSLGEIVVGVFIVVVWLSMRGARHVQGMVTNRHIQDMEWDAEAKTWRLRAHAGRIMNPLEQRLIREFREIVREPLPDPNDPRFKRWNVQGRFPWGWEMVQQQLHERLTRK